MTSLMIVKCIWGGSAPSTQVARLNSLSLEQGFLGAKSRYRPPPPPRSSRYINEDHALWLHRFVCCQLACVFTCNLSLTALPQPKEQQERHVTPERHKQLEPRITINRSNITGYKRMKGRKLHGARRPPPVTRCRTVVQ